VSTVYVADGRILSIALKEKGRLNVTVVRVVRVVIGLSQCQRVGASSFPRIKAAVRAGLHTTREPTGVSMGSG
jgi:hypothetical protein